MAVERIAAVGQVPGDATGPVIRLSEPVSFWGGVDHAGVVSDVQHPDRGTALAGRILVMTTGKGSSSSASVLAELIHAGHGPIAVVTALPDAIIVLGALVPGLLYDEGIPVVVVARSELDRLRTGMQARVVANDDGHQLGEAWVEIAC